MSEGKKKPEKWETKEWIIKSYDLNLGLKKSIGINFPKKNIIEIPNGILSNKFSFR